VLPKLDAIAAIATASGRGGIGVIRVSGSTLESFILALIGQPLIPRYATLLPFLDANGAIIDNGIVLYFPAPNSYTGEDVLELQGHGGPAVLQLVLQRCLELGARLAKPGEFTQRAFLNDKIDLIQAESVADLIDATTTQAVLSASRSLQGAFSEAIHKLVSDLIELRMRIETAIDFPEENVETISNKQITKQLSQVIAQLLHLLTQAKQGSLLREGAHIVLLGEPNVGKSSLLNKLAGEEIALVSEIPGTTRDTIQLALQINGVPLHIIDTAGLRESVDPIEQMGMARAHSAAAKADVILWMMDARYPETHGVIPKGISPNTPKLLIFNKVDLVDNQPRLEVRNNDRYLYISTKSGVGLDLLRVELLKLIGWQQESGVFMARERHLQALLQAKVHLRQAEVEQNKLEIMAEELRLAQAELNQITGEFTADDLLGEIFSRFCIGK
jgi:tRNA modification GTPase